MLDVELCVLTLSTIEVEELVVGRGRRRGHGLRASVSFSLEEVYWITVERSSAPPYLIRPILVHHT